MNAKNQKRHTDTDLYPGISINSMDSLDVLQIPTSLLSSSSNNTSSGQSALPKTINRIVKKKLYKRTTTRTSPDSSGLRRSSSSGSSVSYRHRRHKWGTLYPRDGTYSSLGGFFHRRKSRKRCSSTHTTPSSTRPIVSPLGGTASRSTSTVSSRHTQGPMTTPDRAPSTPQPEQNIVIIESDDDNGHSNTPSPIRNSPLYGRQPRRRDAGLSATIATSSSSSSSLLHPDPLTETSTSFVRHHLRTKDDSTIDSELVGKIRKGPTGEKKNLKLGQVYTAEMEGKPGYVKIGVTEQGIAKRIASLNSPERYAKIHDVPDTTPGAQSRFLNSHHAEQIIHLELYSFRRKAVASGHTEWFEIPMEEAHRVCNKWRKWLIQYKPYGENQQLTEFWEQRLYRMDHFNAYSAAKHGCLHERWMAFLNPSWWDKASYEILIAWRKTCFFCTWIRENYLMIITLFGIIYWASNGVLSFLLYILLVLVVYAGLSTKAKGEDKRS